jgi:hypothetical protein
MLRNTTPSQLMLLHPLCLTWSARFMAPMAAFQPSDTTNCCSLALTIRVRSSIRNALAKRVSPGLRRARLLLVAGAWLDDRSIA